MKNRTKKFISLGMTFALLSCGVVLTDTKECKAAKRLIHALVQVWIPNAA